MRAALWSKKTSHWLDVVGPLCEVDEAEAIASDLEMNRPMPTESWSRSSQYTDTSNPGSPNF